MAYRDGKSIASVVCSCQSRCLGRQNVDFTASRFPLETRMHRRNPPLPGWRETEAQTASSLLIASSINSDNSDNIECRPRRDGPPRGVAGCGLIERIWMPGLAWCRDGRRGGLSSYPCDLSTADLSGPARAYAGLRASGRDKTTRNRPSTKLQPPLAHEQELPVSSQSRECESLSGGVSTQLA